MGFLEVGIRRKGELGFFYEWCRCVCLGIYELVLDKLEYIEDFWVVNR